MDVQGIFFPTSKGASVHYILSWESNPGAIGDDGASGSLPQPTDPPRALTNKVRGDLMALAVPGHAPVPLFVALLEKVATLQMRKVQRKAPWR